MSCLTFTALPPHHHIQPEGAVHWDNSYSPVTHLLNLPNMLSFKRPPEWSRAWPACFLQSVLLSELTVTHCAFVPGIPDCCHTHCSTQFLITRSLTSHMAVPWNALTCATPLRLDWFYHLCGKLLTLPRLFVQVETTHLIKAEGHM